MRILAVLVLLEVSSLQVFGSCVRYSDDFLYWSGLDFIGEEEAVTDIPPPPTSTVTEPPPPPTSTVTEPPPPTSTTGIPSTTTTVTTTATIPDTTQPPTTTTTTPPPTTTTATTTTTEDPYANYEYTKIVMSGKDTVMGQVIFLRGGLDYGANGCSDENPEPCMIPIVHLTEYADPSHIAWAESDNYLDWGAETGQGAYDGQVAGGSPGYWEDGNWVFEFLMDCDATVDGWFEVKGFFQDYNSNYNYWEEWISNLYECADHGNHQAVCGQENHFQWNNNYCQHY